jgi:hypothetical protein
MVFAAAVQGAVVALNSRHGLASSMPEFIELGYQGSFEPLSCQS